MTAPPGRLDRQGGFAIRGVDLLGLGSVLLGIGGLGAFFFTSERAVPGGEPARPALTVLLVDRSASVTRARRGWRRWASLASQKAAEDAAARGDEIALVTFGETAELQLPPVAAERFLGELRRGSGEWFRAGEEDLASRLDAAAEVAVGLITERDRPPGSIVLLGDGVPSGEDPTALLLDPSVTGLELVMPPPADRVDLGVIHALAPDKVEPLVTVPVELECLLVGPALGPEPPAMLVEWELCCTGAEGIPGRTGVTTHRGEDILPIPRVAWSAPGGGERRFRASFGLPGMPSGTAQLTARVRLRGTASDPVPENDAVGASWRIGDPIRVLVVSPEGHSDEGASLFAGPAFEGIEVRAIPAASLKGELATEPLPDAVISMELPLASLPGEELTAFVQERGGGWIHCAGWPLLRTDGNGLEELAALEPDRSPRPPRDIVFFVDGSGSMKGERWRRMREALRKLVPSVPPEDTLSLRFFTQVMGPEEFRFVPRAAGASAEERASEDAQRAEALRALMALAVPGGATDIVGSLTQLADSRVGRVHASGVMQGAGESGEEFEPIYPPVFDGLVILISDGQTESTPHMVMTLKSKLLAGRDELVAIHVGDAAGVAFLGTILHSGRRVVMAQEIDELLSALQAALHDLTLIENARVVTPRDANVLLEEAVAAAEEATKTRQGAPSPNASRPWELTRTPGELALPWVDEVMAAAAERGSLSDPLLVARALPCRTTPGAEPLLVLHSSALAFGGRRSVFAGFAPRGKGYACTLAAPLIAVEDDPWAPRVAGRSGLLAPFLRQAARLRDEADRGREAAPGEVEPALEVEWVPDPRLVLGASAGPRVPLLLVAGPWFTEHAGQGESWVAHLRRPDSVDSAGVLVAGERLASLHLEPLPFASDPRVARFAQRPRGLDELDRGAPLVVTVASASGELVSEPMPLAADGPLELAQLVGTGPLPVFGARGRGTEEPRAVGQGMGPEREQEHPMVPWLISVGLICIFLGASGAARLRS